MITDGRSGWITRDGSADALEAGLLCALATPPSERQAMGKCAAETIREICSNQGVVARQIALRRRVAEGGTTRSPYVAGVVPSVARPNSGRTGMGLVVTCLANPESLPACLATIAHQTESAKTVLVVQDRLRQQTDAIVRSADLDVIYTSEGSVHGARGLGLAALLQTELNLRSIAHIDQDVRLEAEFVAACELVFERQPDVALVSPWVLRDGKRPDLDPGPVPMSLTAVAAEDLPRYSAVRTEILEAHTHPAWKNLTAGRWTAFTFPQPLVSLVPPRGRNRHPRPRRRYSGMALIQSQSLQFTLLWFRSASLPDKLRWLARTALQPKPAVSRLMLLLRKPPTAAPR